MAWDDDPASAAVGAGPEAPEASLSAGPASAAAVVRKSEDSTDATEMMSDVSGLGTVRLERGQVVKGTVLKITESEVIVDIGLKSEGAIPRVEFRAADGNLSVQPGDTIEVWIEDYDEEEGTATVSHEKAARLRAWEEAERSFREKINLPARVIERTKGGLTVDLGGIRAFLPASQADLRPLRNLESLIGQEIVCKVVKLDRQRNNAVVSRREALEEELNRKRARLIEQLEEGRELVGRVKNLTEYGAFVDLGGMDGLLHVTDLSWGRVTHPSEVIKIGQEIRVKVLKFDRQKERISLGLKQLTPDPWEHVSGTYKPGERVFGRVVSLTDYGAFVELEPGVEGLIHVSEMTWSKRLKHPSKILSVNDRVEVAVLDVNPAQRRISLSLRQTLPDPWATLAERLAVGATVHGRVRNLTDFGAFVEIEDGIDGLIHVSDLSWTKTVKHPSDVLTKGQEIDAVVLAIDTEHRRVSLGMKQLQPDIWAQFFAKTEVGSILRGKVVRMAQFGAFVELEPGIEGLCHVSEFDEVHARHGPAPLQVGSELDFRVIRLNPAEKKIGLSLKAVAGGRTAPAEAGEKPAALPASAPTLQTEMARKMAEAMRAASPPPSTSASVPRNADAARLGGAEASAALDGAAGPAADPMAAKESEG
jgi:small subunit ribosomal protein S1